MDILGSLPTEVAAEILQYLPPFELEKCRKVCRRWENLVDIGFLWKKHYQKECWHPKDLRDAQDSWRKRYWDWRDSLFFWLMDTTRLNTFEKTFDKMVVLGDGISAVFFWGSCVTSLSLRNGRIRKFEYSSACRLVGNTADSVVLECHRRLWVLRLAEGGLLVEDCMLNPGKGQKCVAVLESAICIYGETESCVRLYSISEKEIVGSVVLEIEEPSFVGLNDSLYVYNSTRLLEVNKYGKVMFSVNWEVDILQPVFQSNRFLLAVQAQPREPESRTSKIVFCWERSSGRRILRKLEKLHFFSLDQSKPYALIVPDYNSPQLTVKMVNLRDFSIVWEISMKLMFVNRFEVQLHPVLGKYILGMVYKYQCTCPEFFTDMFLIDLQSGTPIRYESRGVNQRLLSFNDNRLILGSRSNRPNRQILRILSFPF